MRDPFERALVTTIKERCRVCYTCVRECPAKAIRIHDGQAEVLTERCIGCGNCVRVCSQLAKQILSNVDEVEALLKSENKVAAIIAPSFPAEFTDIPYEKLVAMMRALGFDLVNEVAFGADLVAERYRRLIKETNGQRFIATSCPAIVGYVERYHPEMVSALSPIVSPMIAAARALRRLHGKNLKVVFIGPCIAKKGEAITEKVAGDVDNALTFMELQQMFDQRQVTADTVEDSDFDQPHANNGALFPISRGMLQAAHISEDLATGEVVAADGRSSFVEAIKEFEAGDLDAKLLEVLCCNGCIMGAGMSSTAPLFSRRSRVSHYVRQRMKVVDQELWSQQMADLDDLDLSRLYDCHDQRVPVPSDDGINMILAEMGKFKPEDELNCGACGYETCREHATAIFMGLAECEMCLPYTIEQLRTTISELNLSNEQLANTKEALSHSEKLASMGQLAAGIAHEVNNPLGVVLMFAHLLRDELGPDTQLKEDVDTIVQNADRCKKIVSGLLHFARQNKVNPESTNMRSLVDNAVKMLTVPGNINLVVKHEADEIWAEVDRDQIIQILTNLISNAQSAMPDGGTVTVQTGIIDDDVKLSVADTGTGISKQHLEKIFDPFFTTKQVGKGTGLGLAVTYGIVKMHRGRINVESNDDPAAGPTGTRFEILLPCQGGKE